MSGRHDVAQRVRELLDERAAAPGDKLPPERELAALLGISRASLREGLARLGDLGVIEARQGSGTYFAGVDLDDLLAVRLRLEPYAAELAAARRERADLDRLDRAVAELRAALDDPAEFGAADLRLHAAVTEAARSPALAIVLGALADLLRHSRGETSSDAGLRTHAVEQCERLVAAIHAGNAAAAGAAMTAHLARVGATLHHIQ